MKVDRFSSEKNIFSAGQILRVFSVFSEENVKSEESNVIFLTESDLFVRRQIIQRSILKEVEQNQIVETVFNKQSEVL